MGVVRSLLGECEVFDRVGVVRRNFVRNVRCLLELGSCKEFVRSIQRYSIELKAVRNLLEVFRGIRLS